MRRSEASARRLRTLCCLTCPNEHFLSEQVDRLTGAGCSISGRGISSRPGYPAISVRKTTPYRLVAVAANEIDISSLGFEPENQDLAGTELILPADSTIFATNTNTVTATGPDRTGPCIES